MRGGNCGTANLPNVNWGETMKSFASDRSAPNEPPDYVGHYVGRACQLCDLKLSLSVPSAILRYLSALFIYVILDIR